MKQLFCCWPLENVGQLKWSSWSPFVNFFSSKWLIYVWYVLLKKKTMIYKQPLIYLFFHFYFNAIDTEIPLALNSSLRIHDTVLFRTQCFPTNQRGDWLQTRELDRGLHWLWFLTIWHAHSIKRGREGGGIHVS